MSDLVSTIPNGYHSGLISTLDHVYEAYISTKQPEAPQDARLPRSDANQGRAKLDKATPSEGAQPIGRIKGPSKARFEEIYSQGKRADGEHFRLHALKGTGLVGVTTAKAIGSIARRNRQKRRARALVDSLGRNEDLDMTVTVKQTAQSADYQDLKRDLETLMTEIRSRWDDGSE